MVACALLGRRSQLRVVTWVQAVSRYKVTKRRTALGLCLSSCRLPEILTATPIVRFLKLGVGYAFILISLLGTDFDTESDFLKINNRGTMRMACHALVISSPDFNYT